jgi:hypothetical protein
VGVAEVAASAIAVSGVDGGREEVVQRHGDVRAKYEGGHGWRRRRSMRGGRGELKSRILVVKEGRGVRSRENDEVIDRAHLEACFKLIRSEWRNNRGEAREMDCRKGVLGERKVGPGEEEWAFREFRR